MESNVNLQSLDPRKQELLEARFLGSRVGNSVCCRRNPHVIGILCVAREYFVLCVIKKNLSIWRQVPYRSCINRDHACQGDPFIGNFA